MTLRFDTAEKPEAQALEKHYHHLETKVWGNALEVMREVATYYFGTNKIWEALQGRPHNRQEYHSFRAAAIIKKAVDAHLAFVPTFHRREVGTGKEHKERSGWLEKGLQEVVEDAAQWEDVIPTKVNGLQLMLYNYTQLHVWLETKRMLGPKRKRGENKDDFERREWIWESSRASANPIRLTVPSPGEVLMPPTGKKPPYVFQNIAVAAYDLEDMSTTRIEKQGKVRGLEVLKAFTIGDLDPYEEIKLRKVWTPYWVAWLKGTEMLWVEDNLWGFAPFGQSFLGGLDMPAGEKPDLAWYIKQTMLYNAKDTLKMSDQKVSAEHEALIRRAFARLVTPRDGAEMAALLALDIDLIGSVKKEDLFVEPQPDLPTHIFTHGEVLDRIIDQTTYSPVVAGLRAVGEKETATGIMMFAEAAGRQFKSAVVNMGQLWGIVGGEYVLRLVKAMDKAYSKKSKPFHTITIGEHPLRVEDMEGEYHVTATFKQVDAVVAQQMKQSAMQEVKAGFLDLDGYYDETNRENGEEIKKGVLYDEVMRTPEVREKLAIEALRLAGLGEMADEREERLKAALAQREIQGRMGAMVDQSGGLPLGQNGGAVPPGGA